MPAVVGAVSMNGSSFEGRSVMLILRDWRFSTASIKKSMKARTVSLRVKAPRFARAVAR
jgi:hypothetical protein